MMWRAVFNDHQLAPLSKTNYDPIWNCKGRDTKRGALSSTWKCQTQLCRETKSMTNDLQVPYKTIEKLSTVMILYETLEEQTPRVRHWILLGNVRHSSRETKSMINDQWSKTFKYHIKASKTFDSKDPLWDVKSAALSSTWKCQTQERKTAWHPRPSNGSKGLKHKTMVMRTNTTKIFGKMVKLCSCKKNPPNLSLLLWRPSVLDGKWLWWQTQRCPKIIFQKNYWVVWKFP